MSTGLSLADLRADLRAQLVPARDIEARERRARLSTGSATLDELLGGGWPRGAISEVRGARGAGRTAVLLASLATSLRAGHAAALVDFAGAFDPWTAARAGVALGHLLWVRGPAAGHSVALPRPGQPPRLTQRSPERLLLAAAEAIASAGGFGLLALDFGERAPPVPTATWLRLRQLATGPGTVVLVVTAQPLGGLFGATSLCLDRARPRFAGTTDARSRTARAAGADNDEPAAASWSNNWAARSPGGPAVAPALLDAVDVAANFRRGAAGAGTATGAATGGTERGRVDSARLVLRHDPTA